MKSTRSLFLMLGHIRLYGVVYMMHFTKINLALSNQSYTASFHQNIQTSGYLKLPSACEKDINIPKTLQLLKI